MISLPSLNIIVQIISALVSLLVLLKYRTSFMINLFCFLLITAFVESFCFFLMKNKKPTFVYHHFYSLIEYLLIFLMYRKLIEDKKWLLVSKVLLVITFTLWVLVFFNRSFFIFIVIIGSFNVGITLFLYLRGLLLSDEILNYKKLLPFWVSVGFLVFYLPSIPFFSFLMYMKNRGLFPVLNILIILMNLFIIYGLITCSKEEKY